MRAHNPAAAEGMRGFVEVFRSKGETSQDALRLGFQCVTVEVDKLLLCVDPFLRIGVGEGAQCIVNGDKFRRNRSGQFGDGFFAGGRTLLWQEADDRAAVQFHFALVRLGAA